MSGRDSKQQFGIIFDVMSNLWDTIRQVYDKGSLRRYRPFMVKLRIVRDWFSQDDWIPFRKKTGQAEGTLLVLGEFSGATVGTARIEPERTAINEIHASNLWRRKRTERKRS